MSWPEVETISIRGVCPHATLGWTRPRTHTASGRHPCTHHVSTHLGIQRLSCGIPYCTPYTAPCYTVHRIQSLAMSPVTASQALFQSNMLCEYTVRVAVVFQKSKTNRLPYCCAAPPATKNKLPRPCQFFLFCCLGLTSSVPVGWSQAPPHSTPRARLAPSWRLCDIKILRRYLPVRNRVLAQHAEANGSCPTAAHGCWDLAMPRVREPPASASPAHRLDSPSMYLRHPSSTTIRCRGPHPKPLLPPPPPASPSNSSRFPQLTARIPLWGRSRFSRGALEMDLRVPWPWGDWHCQLLIRESPGVIIYIDLSPIHPR
ncbi:hypothetical protein V8C35DRAFT_157236 [Trichoderma chlorosporum]